MPRKKLTWRRSVIAAIVFLTLLSLVKLSIYEISGAGSKLRGAVGQTVTFTSDSGLRRGKVDKVFYRMNDKIGFFDLCVAYSDPREGFAGEGGGTIGLSPFAAMDVIVVD